MLFKQKQIDAIADAVEGIAINNSSAKHSADAGIIIFSSREKKGTPLVEISLVEDKKKCRVMIQSPLGVVELADVRDVHISSQTREAAFFGAERSGKLTFVTVSAYGVIQVYANVSPKLAKQDIAKIDSDSLRAAIALKIFLAKGKAKKK